MASEEHKRPGYGYGSYRNHYGAGQGYGGYGAYGGYPGGTGETIVQRTLHDYLLMLRERIWYVIVAFLVVSGSVAAYTFTRLPVYRSEATVEFFRRNPMVMQVQQVMDNQINSAEDLNTQVNILKSSVIVDRVAARLNAVDRQRFVAPYLRPNRAPPGIKALLEGNRAVVPQRLSLIITVQYIHPDKEIAAKVANLFADEYIAYNAHIRVDASMKAVEELELRANEQRKKVDEIANALQAYREKNNSISLDQRKDIVTEKLKELSNYVTHSNTTLQEAKTHWQQVTKTKARGGSLLDLAFIAEVPAVSQMQQQVAALKINVAQLSQRYRPKHPQMSQALKSLSEAQAQLQHAIDTTTAQVEGAYQTALQNNSQAQAALAAQEADSLKLDRYAVNYSNIERDFDVNQKLLEHILERVRETSMSSTVENQNARVIDYASPSGEPFSPNYRLNLAVGVLSGIIFGIALAFIVAYWDDRIKSAFDIETVVGLPLIGIVPEVRRMGGPDQMDRTLAAKNDREVSEAFTTILSTLQLQEQSKKAQCILVTSTVANEGKSFITTSLAQTYAAHGERVIVVDCDLRRPAVNRVFQIENLKGVIDICTAGVSLDDAIVKNVRPSLDVLPTGGRSKNPTQTLNGKAFAQMISDLRKRYDRIFIDTPPVAIVSDALIVLPLVDGSIYAIYFNKVRRKAAQFCVQRLLEVSVPNFGAILNGLTGGVGGYYYSHYYDKSYKNYYATKAENLNGVGEKIVEPEVRQKK